MPHIHHATASRRARHVLMAALAANATAFRAVRRFFAPGFLALALIALSVPAGNATSQKESFLLVVQGRIAALNDGAMTMQTPPSAVLFSDRPARRVLPVNLKTFTDALWGADGSMRRSPPNASIVDENAEEIGVIELTNVSYSGDKLQVHFKALSGKMPKVGQIVAMTVDGLPLHIWSLGGGITEQ